MIAGDIAGEPEPEDIEDCLDKALQREHEPLNTKRKITHSRRLFEKADATGGAYESTEQIDGGEEDLGKTAFGRELYTWDSVIVMNTIEEVAKELEDQGWRIIWQSAVEALAIKEISPEVQDVDIVELLDMLGVKLKKVGKEYMGLCPFHDDHKPSLSVNRHKGLWHCFGCGKGGDVYKFIEEWHLIQGSQ